MLGVGYTGYAIVKARNSVRRSEELLASLPVYPFPTCVEPCCRFKVAFEGASPVPAAPAVELRAQAAHVRHLADNMNNDEAARELRQIADAFDADADNLEPPSLLPAPERA